MTRLMERSLMDACEQLGLLAATHPEAVELRAEINRLRVELLRAELHGS